VPGFLKAAAMVMSGGTLVGVGVLAMLPDEPSIPSSAAESAPVHLAIEPPAPCNRPLWPNTACQTWTLPHRDVEELPASEPTQAPRGATSESRHVRDRTTGADNHKKRAARADKASRRTQAANRMPAVAERGFMNWPTWRPDAFHSAFSERRNYTMRTFGFFGAPAR